MSRIVLNLSIEDAKELLSFLLADPNNAIYKEETLQRLKNRLDKSITKNLLGGKNETEC
jgi:hypothetical protein